MSKSLTKTSKNKTKKSFDKALLGHFTKVMTRIKKYNQNLKNKTKDKTKLIKCEAFMKKEVECIEKKYNKMAKQFNLKPYPKKQFDVIYNLSKLSYCDDTCNGFTFNGNKQEETNFKNKIKDGFNKIYTTDEIDNLKKQGALSGCKYSKLGLRNKTQKNKKIFGFF
jgi:hypothetical protein